LSIPSNPISLENPVTQLGELCGREFTNLLLDVFDLAHGKYLDAKYISGSGSVRDLVG
jgi:hypothetical protein